MEEKLSAIKEAAQQGSPPEALLSELEALHESILEEPEARRLFEKEALQIADGIYLPHLFWMYLAAFLQDKEAYRPAIEYLLQVFVRQPSNPLVEKRMRPLLCIYFSEEAPFYKDRFLEYARRYGYPEKQRFLEKVLEFIPRNPSTVSIFRRKFALIGEYFPNFELFALPIQQIEAELKSSAIE
ncbi:MAG: hypothetical protein NZ958_08240 [Bacteroidia bacterium]|nr:hypothetical protein [Bacteroidia bacterium]MDW8088529.1 hypothetical protein [Bacteroidia bacterium]